MARVRLITSALRTVTAADTNAQIPGAPEDVNGQPSAVLPAGVVSTQGCRTLKVDQSSVGTTAGNFTILVLAWNRRLQAWVIDTTVTLAGMDTSPTPRLVGRATVQNWGSDWAFPLVTALAVGTTSVSVSVIGLTEDP